MASNTAVKKTLETAKDSAHKAVTLTDETRTAVLKALADPRRFELLERIARHNCPLGCSEALAEMPISAATLSHHIKELESAGLIEVRREGKYAFLSLQRGVLEALAATLCLLGTPGCQPPPDE
ncbi:helix-turn-helix transcriptional regulator [Acidobacteria bacterium AB60]|nr:helix-turn-helix transcriptional regulator [Acidobacteria bacterium AB60]